MDFRTLQTSVAVLFFFIGQTSTYREKQSTSFNIVNVLAFEKVYCQSLPWSFWKRCRENGSGLLTICMAHVPQCCTISWIWVLKPGHHIDCFAVTFPTRNSQMSFVNLVQDIQSHTRWDQYSRTFHD
jgi:hypothetical protein